MGKKNPQTVLIEDLKRDVIAAQKDAQYQRGRRDEAEERAQKLESENRRSVDMVMEQHRGLEHQVEWMRQLLELMCVPVEKLEKMQELREKVTMGGQRMY